MKQRGILLGTALLLAATGCRSKSKTAEPDPSAAVAPAPPVATGAERPAPPVPGAPPATAPSTSAPGVKPSTDPEPPSAGVEAAVPDARPSGRGAARPGQRQQAAATPAPEKPLATRQDPATPQSTGSTARRADEKPAPTPRKSGEPIAAAPPASEEPPDAAAPASRTKKPVELFAETAQPTPRPDAGTPPREPAAAAEGDSTPEPVGRIARRSSAAESAPEPESPIPGTRLDIPGAQIGIETARVRRFLESGGAALDGRLVDVDTGKAISGAEIEAWMGTRSVETESDDQGRFRLEGLVPGSRLNLWISAAPSFVQERTEVSVPPDRPGFQSTFKMLSRSASAGAVDGGAGMFLSRRGSRTVVTGLAAFGPAEGAGVRVGDAIVAVAQRKVGELGPGAIDFLLRGPIGSEVQLTVQTGSQSPRRVTLRRSAR